MTATNDTYLPTYDELREPPLNVTSPVLKAGAIYFGVMCEKQSNPQRSLVDPSIKTPKLYSSQHRLKVLYVPDDFELYIFLLSTGPVNLTHSLSVAVDPSTKASQLYSSLRIVLLGLQMSPLFSKEYMLCREEEGDPRKCMQANKAVSQCAQNAYKTMGVHCAETLTNFWKCLDNAPNGRLSYKFCRDTQRLFDECMVEKAGIARPPLGDLARVRLHKTDRPKPTQEHRVYPGAVDTPPEPTTVDPTAVDSMKRTNNRYF